MQSKYIINKAYEDIQDCFFTLDREWCFSYINRQYLNLVDKRIEELIGQVFWEAYPDYIGTPLESALRKSMENHISQRIENRSVITGRWYNIIITPTSEGLGTYWLDITEQKRADEALKESEERFRVLFDSVAQAVWYTDAEGRAVTNSPTWLAYTGQKPGEDLGYGWFNAIHPDDREYARKQWQKTIRSGMNVNLEYRIKNSKGEWVWTNEIAAPIRDCEGKITKWVGISLDISQRKQAEELLQKGKKYQEFMLMLLDKLRSLDDPVKVQMEATRFLGEHLGVDRVAYIQMADDSKNCEVKHDYYVSGLQSFVGHYNLENFSATLNEVMYKGRTLVVNDLDMPFFITQEELLAYDSIDARALINVPLVKEGRLVYFLSILSKVPRNWTAEEVELAEGTAERTWAAVERALAEEALRKSEANALALVEQLRQADESKNQFISILSHELRNPMASIMMGFPLLERVMPAGEKTGEIIEMMKSQASQLSHLIDDLLDISRITLNKIVLKKERLELNELVSKVVKCYQLQFAEKGVDLETELASTHLYIEADPVRLTQVIDNLLHNAFKFSGKGDKSLITVSKDKKNAEALITIKNTDMGIQPELLPNIFQPFVQADNSLEHSHGGLGLGLSIVKEYIEMHGGTIEALSEGIGKGTQFNIRLPLTCEKDSAQEKDRLTELESSGSLRILMIEDNQNFNKIMCQMLSFLGYEASSALNGPEGIIKAKELYPQVILCDIGLPGMSGYEVAQSIREDNELKDTFLVALSGYAQHDDLERSRVAGFNRHLAKPVDLETIERMLLEVS